MLRSVIMDPFITLNLQGLQRGNSAKDKSRYLDIQANPQSQNSVSYLDICEKLSTINTTSENNTQTVSEHYADIVFYETDKAPSKSSSSSSLLDMEMGFQDVSQIYTDIASHKSGYMSVESQPADAENMYKDIAPRKSSFKKNVYTDITPRKSTFKNNGFSDSRIVDKENQIGCGTQYNAHGTDAKLTKKPVYTDITPRKSLYTPKKSPFKVSRFLNSPETYNDEDSNFTTSRNNTDSQYYCVSEENDYADLPLTVCDVLSAAERSHLF